MPPKKGGGGAAGPKAHQLAEEMPPGEILNDFTKGKWRLGAKLGQGGFGLIYLASNAEGKSGGEPMHVVKQEPAGNGPLALECLFYAGTMKATKLESWAKSKRVADLGLPKYVGWGMHTFKSKNNRFLVMDRFGVDLQKLFVERGRFDRVVVAQMALRLIDSLHYLHDNRYVHADIKAANILLPFSKAAKPPASKTVYLVDFGLAAKYAEGDGTHKPYKQDPKRAHDGTVEFTSRDAHMGVAPSRRGDMEILGYCLVQWLCGRLPWEDKLTDKNYVADQKCKFMKDIPAFMRRCFGATTTTTASSSKKATGTTTDGEIPTEIQKYLHLVDELEYSEEPDYNQFKEIFKSFLRTRGVSTESPINFGVAAVASKSSTATPKRGPSIPGAGKAAPKSSRASKNKRAAALKSESDDDDEDEIDGSLSVAFPLKSSSRGAGARKKTTKNSEDEEETKSVAKKPARTTSRAPMSPPPSASASKSSTRATSSAASASSSAASASSSAASVSSSRKRGKVDDDEDELFDDVEETQPLKEVPLNSPGPRTKKPRLIKVKKNVKTADGKTQTTPRRKVKS